MNFAPPPPKSNFSRYHFAIFIVIAISSLFLTMWVKAGSLTPSGVPGATMKTLQEIYDSIAGTFDSSAITASQTGSLIQGLKYLNNNIFVASSSSGFSFTPTSRNVGIGTSTPTSVLHVVGDASPLFNVASGSTSRFAILENGNVGIGTTTPVSLLNIKSTGASTSITFTKTSPVAQTWQLRAGAITTTSQLFDIYDKTANVSRFAITEDGEVRIGSSSNIIGNTSRLFVYGGANGANIDVMGNGAVRDQAVLELEGSDYAVTPNSLAFNYYGPNGIGTTLGFANNKLAAVTFANVNTALVYVSGNTTPLIFGTNDTERMRIAGNGNVGIGTTTASKQLHIASASFDGDLLRLQDSDGTCDHNPEAGSETVTCSSDRRLKENIIDAPTVLDDLSKFRIRQYNVISSDDRMIGVIAQEVQEVFPDLVSSRSSGYLAVQQPSLWQLVKGIQELTTRTSTMEGVLLNQGSASSNQGLLSLLLDYFKSSLVTLKDVIVETFQAKKITTDNLELVGDDGEVYCVRIFGGALQSVRGECGAVLPQIVASPISSPSPSPEPSPESSPTPLPELTPSP